MRIPRDIPLRVYIQRLIDADEVEKFYQTDEWKKLRLDVLEYFHNECQHCLARGKVTTAELCVHHVNELRHRPELALSRWFTDEHGRKQPNLIPLCKKCHNEVHPEKRVRVEYKEKFTNTERW